MPSKPRIFIGSSVEGLKIAEFIQLGLEYYAECTVWHQGVFGLSKGTLEELVRAVHGFDHAVLVLTPDDLVHKRGVSRDSPRDNVVFELGLFMGALGRERTYIVYCRDKAIDLPTDLAGVTAASYAERGDGNLQAALGPVCTKIKMAIDANRGAGSGSDEASARAVEKLAAELESLRSDFTAQTNELRHMMRSMTDVRSAEQLTLPRSPDATPAQLTLLEGAWKEAKIGSMAFIRIINGRPWWIYAYSGSPTWLGEYYNIRIIGDAMIGRFRWLDGSHSGYVYLQRVTSHKLTGGWWYAEDVPESALELLPDVKGMSHSEWIRQEDPVVTPPWAESYFEAARQKP